MSLATRDNCLSGPYIAPYFARAFSQTTTIPQFGAGGNYGETQKVNTESSLTFPYHTRAPNGCTDTIEFHPWLTFDFLPTKWQQPDFRPIHFMEDTRLAIKDLCRTREAIDEPGKYLGCQYENNPYYYQDNEYNSIEHIFDNRPL